MLAALMIETRLFELRSHVRYVHLKRRHKTRETFPFVLFLKQGLFALRKREPCGNTE